MTCGYEASGDTLIFQRCLSPSESDTELLLNGKLNKFLPGGMFEFKFGQYCQIFWILNFEVKTEFLYNLLKWLVGWWPKWKIIASILLQMSSCSVLLSWQWEDMNALYLVSQSAGVGHISTTILLNRILQQHWHRADPKSFIHEKLWLNSAWGMSEDSSWWVDNDTYTHDLWAQFW